MRGVNCQVSRTGGRPIRMNLPNTKSVTPYVLSHTLAKQVNARVSPAINKSSIARARYCWGSGLAGIDCKISHTGSRLICQWGSASGNNNDIIPNFTRAECNEA
eukprot:1121269-Pleurochrysis_carterae.AAC.1